MKRHLCKYENLGKWVRINSPAATRPVWPFWWGDKECMHAWPVGEKRTGQTGSGQWKRTCVVSTFVRAVGHGLNADRLECRPLKIAVCGRTQCHMANHLLAVRYSCQSSRSAFRPFGLLTRVKQSVRFIWKHNSKTVVSFVFFPRNDELTRYNSSSVLYGRFLTVVVNQNKFHL